MIYKRIPLAETLEKLRRAVPEVRSSTLPFGILLNGDTARACNLELCVDFKLEKPIESTVILPTKGAQLICSAIDDIVEIKVSGSMIGITSGNIKANLSTQDIKSYPTIAEPMEHAKSCTLDAEVLRNAFASTIYAVAKDDRKPAQKGLCISQENGTLEVCAADGYRLALNRVKCEDNGSFKFILPAMAARALEALDAKGPIEVIRDHKRAIFRTADFTMTTVLIEGAFVNYTQVIPQKFNNVVKIDRREVLSVLNRVKLASGGEKEKVPLRLYFDAGYCRAVMRSSLIDIEDTFGYVEPIQEVVKVGVNNEYFMEALKNMSSDTLTVVINGQLSPILIVDEHCVALVLPVKIKGEVEKNETD